MVLIGLTFGGCGDKRNCLTQKQCLHSAFILVGVQHWTYILESHKKQFPVYYWCSLICWYIHVLGWHIFSSPLLNCCACFLCTRTSLVMTIGLKSQRHMKILKYFLSEMACDLLLSYLPTKLKKKNHFSF